MVQKNPLCLYSGDIKELVSGDTLPGGGGGGDALSKAFAQTAHGFAVGDVIYPGASEILWAKADIDAVGTLGIAIVSAVADANNFTTTFSGYISGLTGLTAGIYYYTSSTPGALSSTDGASYSNPVLYAFTTTTGLVLPWRANSISGSSGSNSGGGLLALDITRPTTTTLAINATNATLRDSSGNTFDTGSITLTCDLTTTGANGRQSGALGSQTTQIIYIISDGTTTASFSHLDTETLTLPGAYIYWKEVSTVNTDTGSLLLDIKQLDKTAWITARTSIATGLNITSYTIQVISTVIPTKSGLISEVLFAGTATGTLAVTMLSDDGVNAKTVFTADTTPIAIGNNNELYDESRSSPVFIPISGNNVYYKVLAGSLDLYARAYKLNI